MEERALVLAPTGRDGLLAVQALRAAGLAAEAMQDMGELCVQIEQGVAVVLIAQEALAAEALARLEAVVEAQPAWSDLPIVVFTTSQSTALLDRWLESIREALRNVTLLERPLRSVTLLTAVRGALRARRRQYELRDLLKKREEEVVQRDHFLAMLGHELRNPLATITMASDIMQRSQSEAFTKQRLLISRQARHLARLVDDLLDVSRVTTGKIVLQRSAVDLKEVVQRGLTAADVTIKSQRLSVTIHGCEKPVVVDGDLVRLEQIFTNLLTNAIKYTPAGGHLELGIEREGEQGVLRLRDSGMGIAPEMLGKVFELFTQVENTLDRARGGLGIGLTVVRRLVELHGGRVDAFSDGVGRGSEFVVRLPLRNAVNEADASTGLSVHATSRHIVLIEDQPDFRELMQATLEELGHRVEVAADGQAGLDLLLERRPEVALIDIGLPRLNGYEVARAVRASLGPAVYLVAVTGYGQPEDGHRAYEAGFDVHLTKPIDFDVLEKVLGRRAS